MTRRIRRQSMARGIEAQRVDLRIDRLTLEGVSRIEGRRIVDSLAQALSREIEERTLPDTSRQEQHESADLPFGRRLLPEEAGAELARIVARQVLP